MVYNTYMKWGGRLAVACALSLALSAGGYASAARYTNSDYTLEGSLDANFGVNTSNSGYNLVAAGGESQVGNGLGGSYILAQQYFPPAAFLELSVQPANLAAYYAFDEGTGTVAADASRYANNGTNSAANAWGSGKINGGWADTSGSQSVTIADSTALPTGAHMTLEAWIYPRITAQMAIASQWNTTGPSNAWALQTTPSGTDLRLYVASSTADSGANYVETSGAGLTLNTWQHITVVYDGTQAAANRVKLYKNGVPLIAAVTGTIATGLANASSALTVADMPGLNRYFQGGLDEVKLYNRSLSSAEVVAEYTAQNAGVASGLPLGPVVAGTSVTADADVAVNMSGVGYQLFVAQDHDLQFDALTIPGVSASIADPAVWAEGTTKGLGLTLTGSTATPIPAKWSSGTAYAALPGATTSLYTRSGASGGVKDVIGLRYRLDTSKIQPPGDYTNTVTYTGVVVP